MTLLKHTGFNLIGLGAPLLVATFSIPLLIEALGVPRFGLLTLIWAVSSYFGLFDLGLGRALTQRLAGTFARGDHQRAGTLAATGLALMGAVGTLAGVMLALLAPWFIAQLRSVPQLDETLGAVYAMCWAMPAIVLTTGMRGILEAKHAFGIINLIRLPMGLFTFLGPLAAVLLLPPRLDTIAWVLAGGRIVFCLVHALFALGALPERSALRPRRSEVWGLCVSGGWLSVGNIVGPFMGYVDRFMIGLLVSSAAVAYYATPQELVTKLWIIPGALTAVLFPTFAAHAASSSAQGRALFQSALAWIYCALLPLTLGLALFASELLQLWLGVEMAEHATLPLRIFALGMFINCLATIPYTLLQGIGQARATALIHLAELPVFMFLLWFLITRYGLPGAVAAWILRIVIDTVLMFHFGLRALGSSLRQVVGRQTLGLAALAAAGFGGMFIASLPARVAWLTVACALTLPLLLRQLRLHDAARVAETHHAN